VQSWINLREENKIFILKGGGSVSLKTMKVSVENK